MCRTYNQTDQTIKRVVQHPPSNLKGRNELGERYRYERFDRRHISDPMKAGITTTNLLT